MTAGKLGVFFAKVRGEHHETQECVEARTMVYVIEGKIVLVSRAVLETLGCIPKTFPCVGEFLERGDDALTGKAFAVNPNPTGWQSNGTFDATKARTPENGPNIPPTTGPRRGLPRGELAGSNPDTVPNPRRGPSGATGVRQPKGECDPESELPCSCPRSVYRPT